MSNINEQLQKRIYLAMFCFLHIQFPLNIYAPTLLAPNCYAPNSHLSNLYESPPIEFQRSKFPCIEYPSDLLRFEFLPAEFLRSESPRVEFLRSRSPRVKSLRCKSPNVGSRRSEFLCIEFLRVHRLRSQQFLRNSLFFRSESSGVESPCVKYNPSAKIVCLHL